MSESREIPLASLLRSLTAGPVELTIEESDSVVYFELNGHKFCTWGVHVHNEHHPMYGSPALAAMAQRRDTPEEAEEMKRFNENFERFMEYRAPLMERIFTTALKVLAQGGPEAFLSYVDTFVDITEHDDGCQGILRVIEKNSKNSNQR